MWETPERRSLSVLHVGGEGQETQTRFWPFEPGELMSEMENEQGAARWEKPKEQEDSTGWGPHREPPPGPTQSTTIGQGTLEVMEAACGQLSQGNITGCDSWQMQWVTEGQV